MLHKIKHWHIRLTIACIIAIGFTMNYTNTDQLFFSRIYGVQYVTIALFLFIVIFYQNMWLELKRLYKKFEWFFVDGEQQTKRKLEDIDYEDLSYMMKKIVDQAGHSEQNVHAFIEMIALTFLFFIKYLYLMLYFQPYLTSLDNYFAIVCSVFTMVAVFFAYTYTKYLIEKPTK